MLEDNQEFHRPSHFQRVGNMWPLNLVAKLGWLISSGLYMEATLNHDLEAAGASAIVGLGFVAMDLAAREDRS